MRLITRVSLSLARQQTAHAPVCVNEWARRESFWNAKCSALPLLRLFSLLFRLAAFFISLSLSLVLCRARGMLLFEFEVPVYYPFKKGKQKISEMIYACWRRVCAHEVNIALFSLALSWNMLLSLFSSSCVCGARQRGGERTLNQYTVRACADRRVRRHPKYEQRISFFDFGVQTYDAVACLVSLLTF